ncbi:OB-fold nucleic acid binding domain-containing protein [Microvirga calopogonii]|uniref:OB-fold nucleic acid binding domain-containing protein n=1 Tax=Microvirga calopogonii TaxID=2078013 RepID=UPI001FE20B0C|nr:OB-fold nucleic acid binding domain-containing protein [Microvirga calopogonii]
MTLFAAADERERAIRPEVIEPNVDLVPMTEGREVVDDYRSKRLTLRRHPLSFRRGELTARSIASCEDLHRAWDGQRITVAGLILVRQKPGSAKGVTFMTIEDETDVANLVIWAKVFEKQQRLILSTSLIACRGRLQREGGVTHLIADHFIDLSDLLRSVAERDGDLRVRSGRGDEARTGTRDWIRSGKQEINERPTCGRADRLNEAVIKVASRNFRR